MFEQNGVNDSLFIGHNETMNVWTHVVGVCFIIGLAVLTYSLPLKNFFKVDAEYATYNSLFEAIAADWNSDAVPRWPILVFLYGAYFCLRGSSVYHGFYCISFIVENIVQTIDYCGVTINVLGSYIPILYYSFYCYPEYRKLHLTITIILNIINLSIMATPKYRAPETRPIRAISYICVSCYIFIAMFHLYTLDGFNNPFFEYSIKYIFLMAASYLSGACCYVLRIPERFAPGKFDYVVCVLIGFSLACLSSIVPCFHRFWNVLPFCCCISALHLESKHSVHSTLGIMKFVC